MHIKIGLIICLGSVMNNIDITINFFINSIESISSRRKENTKEDYFGCITQPDITFKDYIIRLKQLQFDYSSIIIGSIYIDRFIKKTSYKINNFNAFKLSFIAIILGMKYNEGSPLRRKLRKEPYFEFYAGKMKWENLKNWN